MNVSKAVIVVDGRYLKRLFVFLELVIEFQRVDRILGAEMIALLLGGFDFERRSLPELVNVGRGNQPGRSAGGTQQFLVRGFEENLEVGLSALRTGAIKGVNVP